MFINNSKNKLWNYVQKNINNLIDNISNEILTKMGANVMFSEEKEI